MQARISKTLEAIIARVAFDTSKSSITHSLKDHLMLEILRDEGSLACQILSAHLKSWEIQQVRERIKEEVEKATSIGQLDDAQAPQPQLPETFFTRYREELQHIFAPMRSVSTAHVLLHVASDPRTATAQVLSLYHIGPQELAREVRKFSLPSDLLSKAEIRFIDPAADGDLPKPSDEGSLLEKFGTDLTHEAREGRIDPVIGREAEIERMIQILSRRKKNNPILIGEAGVGKTAIAEGLALRMAAGEVPVGLRGKSLWSLDVGSLVAGTKFRGEFEERMQKLLDQLRQSRDTILFIDEIHTIAGAGSTQGSLDTANILKPALARGELQAIGATTLDEFRENIESDAALERRFQKILVEPASAEDTLHILRRIAPHYEAHHGVHYTDEALQSCVELTGRYITDRHFPDKAIDVLDEAGARLHLLGDCPEGVQPKDGQSPGTQAFVAPEVLSDHIRQVITSMTGIPAERLSESENERMRGLQAHLDGRVIGQGEAVGKVARSIRRSRAGLKDEGHPLGVFLFVGPTGVGKTLLAKELSRWMFDEKKGLVRIDMSEYSEKHNVARLIGSPPGYVGYGEGGQLTEAVRRHPYAVVLFDEIEKAHPEVFNALLQIFDEGQLTDGSGRKVDFRNTVIIMTSNAGSRTLAARPAAVGYSTPSKVETVEKAPQTEYHKALEETFAPEFLNRIDDIVVFRTLELEDVEQIIDLELKGLLERIEKLGYRVEITPEAKRALASMGFEQKYGVRALRRTLMERVEDPLSSLVIDGKLRAGEQVRIESDGKEGVSLQVA